MTRREALKIVKAVFAELSKDRRAFGEGACFVTAQLAVKVGPENLLYHEGYFPKQGHGLIAHAWNSINGHIIDFSAPFAPTVDCFLVPSKMRSSYRAEYTATGLQVAITAMKSRRLTWQSKVGR